MPDLFTFVLAPEIKGHNKKIFWEVINELPDGYIIKITPFTQKLRERGANLSEESTSRYMRFARSKWNFGVDFQAKGKGIYILRRKQDDKIY